MKHVIAITLFALLAGCASSNTESMSYAVDDQLVEASCGQCQFGVTDPPGCDLAIRMNNAVYFVDGAHIDDFGDAHAADGFCQAIRHARVTGRVQDNRFRAENIVILPTEDQ